MPEPTPGQRCYTGYVQTRHGMSEADAARTYVRSVPEERAAWEAAAEAVRLDYNAEMAQAWAQGEAQRHDH